MTSTAPLPTPALILAADHRARAVVTTENWDAFFGALAKALPSCDGILATAQPLAGLAAAGHLTALHRTYLSINRTGLAGSVFELDDRLVASVPRAAAEGWSGIKHMTRIDMDDPITASALELLGQVLEQSKEAGLEALIEPLTWEGGRIRRDTDGIVLASIIAHDMGAPVIKVPVPTVPPGAERRARHRPGGGQRQRARPLPRRPAHRGRPRRRPRRGARRHGGRGSRHGHGAHHLPGSRPGRGGGPGARAGARPMILTIDFGTSVTKVGLWGDEGLVALARSELTTNFPQVGWTEQDPLRWWTSLVIACAEARAQAPLAFAEVDVVSCSGARQTFVPVSAEGDPIGKGILWSDHRAAAEARMLAERMGGDDINRARTGIPLDAGAVAAKLAWLAEHQPERIEAAHVILSPRDFIVYRMTDQLVTDATFASRSGLYDFDGNAVRELAGPALGKLPSVVPSDTVVGQLKPVPAAELGLRPGVPIVIGAGDRQCEVLGSGASEYHPMVSWGTTANVSVPVQERPVPAPVGAVVTRAADGGWLLEGGLSAAGSFLAWLGRLLDRSTEELGRLAAESGPGARGVVAVPWLDGARAPWWRDDARAGFMGLGAAHGAADMARAVVESVAWDVVRVMEVVTVGRLGGSTAEGVTLGGAGSGLPVWVEVLTSVLGLPALRHRSGEAASAGAALLAGKALGMGLTLEQIDPVAAVIEPTSSAVELYRALRPRVDHVAAAVLAATESLPGTGPLAP